MKKLFGISILLVLFLGAVPRVGAEPAPEAAAAPAAKHWVCPMKDHEEVFDHPGTCPKCGMDLVEQRAAQVVDILIYDHIQDVDFAILPQIFGVARMDVHLVAPTKAVVTTTFGLKLTPDFSIDDAPAPDVLVIPGGGVHKANLPMPWAHVLPTEDDPRIFDWVRRSAEHARVVFSICNGAFVLAKAGLLDGLPATATASFVKYLPEAGKGISPRSGVRWVDAGKIVTSGGEACGIDAAFHVIARLQDEASARRLARAMEYRWDPEGKGLPPL